ncbi:MAG: peptidylprolyl isomerase [Ruegeria sp.]
MRVLREPLFHFILIGIAIFGWFALVAPDDAESGQNELIVIDDGDVDLLVSRFQNTWKRAPRKAELQALIDATVREEVLVREARKLGLDRGDQVIRARLAQKMGFLNDAVAAAIDPEDSELEGYLDENAARFMTSPQVAFDQVFMGSSPDPAAIQTALAVLNSGADWTGVGVPSLLPRTMPLSALRSVDNTFGRGFSASIVELETDIWLGPIRSGYGQHLVRITDVRPGILPPFEDIRDVVLLEWRRDMGAELAQAQYDNLAARYQIETPETGKTEE